MIKHEVKKNIALLANILDIFKLSENKFKYLRKKFRNIKKTKIENNCSECADFKNL